MKFSQNILGTIGNTPLVKLNKIVNGVDALVLAKVETFNPGNSVKDRMAIKMIEDAEADGRLQPGGTIIEGTSGNTGMGLALAAIVKGYKLICVISDKQSKEKMDILRAVGAKVVVCPTDVEPTDPRSYYSVSKRLAEETPNSWYANQYDNPSNAIAHYEQTGPEIWEQTEGKITHFVVGVGTGGTISGVAKYLKEKNPNIKIVAVEPADSPVLSGGAPGPHKIQGIGAGFIPKNYDASVVDEVLQVSNDNAILTARQLAQEEGLLVGISSGAATYAATILAQRPENKGKVIVTLLPDTGERYLSTLLYAFEEYPL